MRNNHSTVGKAEVRKDALDKVTGNARYICDIGRENLKIGLIVRSKIHHGTIRILDVEHARRSKGVIAVITAKDIPGAQTHGAIILDQPVLASDKIRHLGEPVAIIVAETADDAALAAKKVVIEFDELPAVFDPEEALAADAPRLYENGNLLEAFKFEKGDLARGFASADVIVEKTFSLPCVAPAYLETESAMADYAEGPSLTVWVSSQKPYGDRHEISSVLGVAQENIRMISGVVGGAFGGKEDSSLPILAALCAFTIKGAVKLVNSRSESFMAHPKRHAAKVYFRIGAKNDGTFCALEVRSFLDTGAYASYGTAVGSLYTELVTGSYRFDNAMAETFVAYTNRSIAGAMRGFGGPQANFCLESAIEELAVALKMDSIDLREKNVLKPGDSLLTGVRVFETANSIPLCLDLARKEIEKMRLMPAGDGKACGVGMALGAQTMGLGFGVPDDSTNRIEWNADGKVSIKLGAIDIGQGLNAVSEQMVAEYLGVPYADVSVVPFDSDISPDGGVTCASRMTYLVGNSLKIAAENLIHSLESKASFLLGAGESELSYGNGVFATTDGLKLSIPDLFGRLPRGDFPLTATATFGFPYPSDNTPKGLPFGVPHVLICFGAHVARVEVDESLGTVEVKDYTAIHDVGKAINPKGIEGQIEGGVSMGIGYALFEELALKGNGRWTESFSEYLIPTSMDMPEIKSIILEIPQKGAPFGAKGIGEMVTVPVASAVAGALFDAVGYRALSLPIQAEAIASFLRADGH